MKEKALVLVVDDTPTNIRTLSEALKDDYRIQVALNGRDALALIERHLASGQIPDIILLDIMMPEMNGYEVCTRLKNDPRTAGIPVIFITALHEEAEETHGLELGAVDYIIKPFSLPIVRNRVQNHIQLKQYRDYLEDMIREQTQTIQEERDTAVRLREKAERQLEHFLLTLSSAIESKDKYTGGHVERVANYARDIAREFGMTDEEVRTVYLGAIVHDVGKIGVKDAILNKPDKLTAEEYEIIKSHAGEGYRLLGKMEDIERIALIALCHQERWDGTGYPQGLGGENIPLEARIVTIADYWDAIVTDRPYRSAFPAQRAVEIMRDERGHAFEPRLLDIFLGPSNAIFLRYLSEDKRRDYQGLPPY